jgi:hypothetical protein
MAAESGGHLHEPELERAPVQKGIDIFLGLALIEVIPWLQLWDEIVPAFQGSEILVGELSPLPLNFLYDYFPVLRRWIALHDFYPKKLQQILNSHSSMAAD